MNVKQFCATNSREALHQVKRELGADAVILSNRRVEGGVEILAIAHAEARALNSAVREPVVAKPAGVRTAMNNLLVQPSQTVKVKMPAPARAQQVQTNTQAKPAQPPAPVAAAPLLAPPAAEQIARTVIREIQSMRGMINEQLSGLMFGEMQRRDPDRLRMMSMLLASGFSPALSRRLLEKAPSDSTMAELHS
jgi:flagellar biosynthesis protein FlhF